MKSRKIALIAVAAALLIGVLAIVLHNRDGSAEMVIGGAFALTGDAADWGQDERRGVELAVQDWREENPGRKIKLAVEDAPATDVSASVTAFRTLVDLRGAKVVIGPTWDDAAAAIAPLADRERVVVVAPDASSGIERERDYGFFFSVFTPEQIELRRLVQFLRAKGASKVATVYNQDPFSRQWRDAFANAAAEQRLNIVEEFPVGDPETQDFRTQIERLKRLDIDAVYVEFTTQDTKGPFMRQARELGLQTLIVSSSTSETESLLRNYGEYLEGLTYAYPRTTPSMGAFLAKFQKAFGTRPRSPAAPYAYDATRLVLSVIAAGHQEPSEIKSALLAIRSYDGVTATGLRFGETGRVQWPSESFIIKRVSSGQPEPIAEP